MARNSSNAINSPKAVTVRTVNNTLVAPNAKGKKTEGFDFPHAKAAKGKDPPAMLASDFVEKWYNLGLGIVNHGSTPGSLTFSLHEEQWVHTTDKRRLYKRFEALKFMTLFEFMAEKDELQILKSVKPKESKELADHITAFFKVKNVVITRISTKYLVDTSTKSASTATRKKERKTYCYCIIRAMEIT